MCETHSVDDTFWLRKVLMRVYGKWIDDTLGFYLALGKMSKLPAVGGVIRFFARQYGRYYHGGRAATVEECLDIINSASQISVMDCACRVLNGKCDSPIKTCITVNTSAEVFTSLKDGISVSKQEAAEVVVDSYKKGLIRAIHHCIAPNTYALCNCCTCCCVPYRLRMEYDIETAMENGNMAAVIDRDKCEDCGNCVRACPQKALDPKTGFVDADLCLGCGLCTSACPAGALEMVLRENLSEKIKPGQTEKFLMYTAFIMVILPIAFGFKLTNNFKTWIGQISP